MGRGQSTKKRDAEHLRNVRREHLRLLAEMQRLTLSQQEVEFQSARIRSQWEEQVQQLELQCRREVSNGCPIWRNCSIGCRTHHWKHMVVYSSKFLSRERGFFISIRLFTCSGWFTLCKKTTNTWSSRDVTFGHISREETLRTEIQKNMNTTTRLPATGEPPSVSTAGGEPCAKQSAQQWCPNKTGDDDTEFEKFQNSSTFVI